MNKKMNSKKAEEATQVTPDEIMTDIMNKNDKFETIRVLMEILCKELGVPPQSEPKEIFNALHQVSVEYYKAMESFKDIRSAATKHQGKTSPGYAEYIKGTVGQIEP